jgi:deferrochelatase/peroxidase EfeB
MSDKKTLMQRALGKAPGVVHAVVFFERKEGANTKALAKCVRSLISFGESPPNGSPHNLYTLAAISGDLLSAFVADGLLSQDDADKRPTWPLRDGQPQANQNTSLLVQVSAQTHAARLYALRTVQSLVASAFNFVAERTGERILDGLEPFGFRDATSEPAAIKQSVEMLGSRPWLLAAELEQKVDEFFSLGNERDAVETRAQIIGASPGLQVLSAAEDGRQRATASGANKSHKAHMKGENWGYIVRRGFPYRHDGQEGLVFIAAAAKAKTLTGIFDHFLNGDALNAYVTLHRLGFWFCPPATFVSEGAPLIPASALALRPTMPMHAYEVTESELTYFKLLRDAGAWPGASGEMRLPAGVRAKLEEAHGLLANGSSERKASLDKALDDLENASNQVNKQAGRYITKG